MHDLLEYLKRSGASSILTIHLTDCSGCPLQTSVISRLESKLDWQFGSPRAGRIGFRKDCARLTSYRLRSCGEQEGQSLWHAVDSNERRATKPMFLAKGCSVGSRSWVKIGLLDEGSEDSRTGCYGRTELQGERYDGESPQLQGRPFKGTCSTAFSRSKMVQVVAKFDQVKTPGLL